ncbi:MAG: hypothetical protein BAJALOKI2v1_310014 [Promethearchaeota archaeon]|nr:MAG: hypothetical protein BAJALOKI2v1_310014 [Candidatus Lokiarchaeota archaeon]
MSEKGEDVKGKSLLFVYNADSGLGNAVKDYFQKAFRPSSYQCNLCAVTFGALGEKRSWKNFTENLKIPTRFLHKDEFIEEFNKPNVEFPCAFLKENDNLTLFISKEEMESVEEVVELKDLVYEKLVQFNI